MFARALTIAALVLGSVAAPSIAFADAAPPLPDWSNTETVGVLDCAKGTITFTSTTTVQAFLGYEEDGVTALWGPSTVTVTQQVAGVTYGPGGECPVGSKSPVQVVYNTAAPGDHIIKPGALKPGSGAPAPAAKAPASGPVAATVALKIGLAEPTKRL